MKKILFIVLPVFFILVTIAGAQEASHITEKQLAEITQTLKNVLEENHKLADQNEETKAHMKDLESQFQNVQKESSDHSEDIEFIKKEQSLLQQENDRLKKVIQDFKAQLNDVVDQQERNALQFAGKDYSNMKVSEKADLVVQKSVEVKQDTADIYYQMADEAFSSRQYEQAIAYYQKYLTLNPDTQLADQVRQKIQAAQDALKQ